MSDPKYNTYAGELRFDDDNIVDVNLEPDTENITVLLNGEEVTGGSELPEVDSEDNGKVLTLVSEIKIIPVTVTYDDQTDQFTINTLITYTDIAGWIQAGYYPVAVCNMSDTPNNYYYMYPANYSPQLKNVTFTRLGLDETTGVSLESLNFYKDGEVDTAEYWYTLYPSQNPV